jgi:hypothetical protein
MAAFSMQEVAGWSKRHLRTNFSMVNIYDGVKHLFEFTLLNCLLRTLSAGEERIHQSVQLCPLGEISRRLDSTHATTSPHIRRFNWSRKERTPNAGDFGDQTRRESLTAKRPRLRTSVCFPCAFARLDVQTGNDCVDGESAAHVGRNCCELARKMITVWRKRDSENEIEIWSQIRKASYWDGA